MTNQYREPDRKAPRYRTSRLGLLNKELHSRFVNEFPEHNGVDSDQFKDIIRTFNNAIWENAIESRDGTELPEGLGFTFIGTCPPPKKKNYDPIASTKYGQKISHRNFESDNFLAKIFYTNFASKYKFKDREVWKFTGVRDFKIAVAKAYPDNWKKYVQIDNWQNVSKLFMRKITKTVMTRMNKIVTDDYNEFAL